MANVFTQHNIAVNDQNRLIGAAARQNDGEMDIVLNQGAYVGLTALQRIDVKNYALEQARAQAQVGIPAQLTAIKNRVDAIDTRLQYSPPQRGCLGIMAVLMVLLIVAATGTIGAIFVRWVGGDDVSVDTREATVTLEQFFHFGQFMEWITIAITAWNLVN